MKHATGSMACSWRHRLRLKLQPRWWARRVLYAAIPMAMQPFCGYNFGDYWQHWLDVGAKLTKAPRIFHVNWFRRDADGKFLWPGFGENLRVLDWVLRRCTHAAGAVDTPIGNLPHPSDLNLQGLDISAEAMQQLLAVEPGLWKKEVAEVGKYLEQYGSRLPAEMLSQLQEVSKRLAGLNP